MKIISLPTFAMLRSLLSSTCKQRYYKSLCIICIV